MVSQPATKLSYEQNLLTWEKSILPGEPVVKANNTGHEHIAQQIGTIQFWILDWIFSSAPPAPPAQAAAVLEWGVATKQLDKTRLIPNRSKQVAQLARWNLAHLFGDKQVLLKRGQYPLLAIWELSLTGARSLTHTKLAAAVEFAWGGGFLAQSGLSDRKYTTGALPITAWSTAAWSLDN